MGFLNRKKITKNLDQKFPSKSEWKNHVVTLDGKKIDEFIQKYPLLMIEFWAPWCAPCKKMSPRIRRLSTIYKRAVAFGKINTQNNLDIVKKYNILGIPHFRFYSYGKKIAELSGVKSVGEIKETIDNLLKKNKQKKL